MTFVLSIFGWPLKTGSTVLCIREIKKCKRVFFCLLFLSGSSNFSQMIWKSSKLVGIGIAKFPGRNTYVIVVQYFPAGNTNSSGDFQENVPPVHHFESSV